MNIYQAEISRIKLSWYSNQRQLEIAIATRKFIDDHFEENLNLDVLSLSLFTSKYHLLRLFKKYYGLTPKQYCTNRRIGASIAYLKKGMSISDSCYCAGFETPSSFSTLFRSKTGLSPIAFQKKQFLQSAPAAGLRISGSER